MEKRILIHIYIENVTEVSSESFVGTELKRRFSGLIIPSGKRWFDAAGWLERCRRDVAIGFRSILVNKRAWELYRSVRMRGEVNAMKSKSNTLLRRMLGGLTLEWIRSGVSNEGARKTVSRVSLEKPLDSKHTDRSASVD